MKRGFFYLYDQHAFHSCLLKEEQAMGEVMIVVDSMGFWLDLFGFSEFSMRFAWVNVWAHKQVIAR